MPTLAKNKRAFFDYEILETYEAGLMLTGGEVKSARSGSISLRGAFVTLRGQTRLQRELPELFLTNATISAYQNQDKTHEPQRPRKLLLRKKEIASLVGKRQARGLTLVPLSVYTKGRHIKLEFGLGKGKKKLDKRETIKKRETDREIHRKLKITRG